MNNKLYTVVLVDDEKLIRKGLRYLINWEANGFTIVGEAENGKEAIDIIKNEKPDLIFTDIVMPIMNGIELLNYLKINQIDVKCVVLSSHDDFNYVKQAMKIGALDYFLKDELDENNLLTILDTIKGSIAPNPKHSLVSNLEKSLSAYLQGFSELDYFLKESFRFEHFILLNTKFQSYESMMLFKQLLNNFLIENKFRSFIISENFPELIVLLNYCDIQQEVIVFELEKLLNILPHQEKVFLTYSNQFNKIEHLKNEYQDILTASDYSFYSLKTDIISSQRLLKKTSVIAFEREHYQDLLDRKMYFHALDYFYTYIQESILYKSLSPSELKAFSGSVIYNFLSNLNALGMKSDNLNSIKLEFLFQINNTSDARSFLNTFNRIMSDLSIIIQKYFNKQESYLVCKIESFLSNNYHLDLSLDDLANHLSFSYHYTSNIFNQLYNKSFTDYLNDLRISKSQELLRNPQISISAIYNKVGFSSHSYFSTIFKNKIGLTPSQYRKKVN